MKRMSRSIAGFTLMEINLVLFLFGAGVTAMLGIFPVGLRQAQFAVSDSVQVGFATRVLSSLESNAALMCKAGDSADWNNTTAFTDAVLGIKKGSGTYERERVSVKDVDGKECPIWAYNPREASGDRYLIKNYPAEKSYVRYMLVINQLSYDGNKGMLPYLYKSGIRKPLPRYRAALWVIDMKNGKPKSTKPYIADFQYIERSDMFDQGGN